MEKKMRRFLALVLALAVCAGQLALPAMATETVSGSGTPEDPQVTVTVTVKPNHTVVTDTNTQWSSTDNVTDSSTTGDNPQVEVSTDVTTTVTGNEDKKEVAVYNPSTGVVTTNGELHGEETTVVEGQTVTTTTTKDTLIDDTIRETESWTEPLEEDSYEKPGAWTDVPNSETDNQWNYQKTEEGTLETIAVETEPEEVFVAEVPDDLNPDVVLDGLTPGGATVRETVPVTFDDVKDPDKDYTGYDITETKDGWTATKTDTTTVRDNQPAAETILKETPGTAKTVLPEGYTPGKTQVDENTTRLIEEEYDEKGNFLGYKITTTKVTVDKSDNFANPDEKPYDEERGGYEDKNEYGTEFTPPAKPTWEGSTTDENGNVILTDEDGNTVTITVTEVLGEDGVTVIRYDTTAITTDKKGNELFRENRSIGGTETNIHTLTEYAPDTEMWYTNTTVTTTEVEYISVSQQTREVAVDKEKRETYDTTIVTDKDVYQLVTTENGEYFLFEGKMYKVTGTNTVTENLNVATKGTVPILDKKGNCIYGDADDIREKNETVKGEYGETKTVTTHYSGEIYTTDTGKDGKWTHVGYGLYSDFTMKDTLVDADGNPVKRWNSTEGKWEKVQVAHGAKQFMIQDGDEIRYVYCVELGAGIDEGTYYSSKQYDTDHDNVSPWEKDDGSDATGTVQQLRSVALNGFWGTENGLGSLQAVKDLMARNGLEKEANNLTVGMALAATQIAIWEFSADENSRRIFEEDCLTFDDELGSAPSEEDQETIMALRDLLVSLAKDTNTPDGKGVAEVIDANAITGGAITLKSKVTKEDGSAKTDSEGNDLYKSDLSFKLDVSTSSLNGDMVLLISDDNGREIGKYRLAGDGNKGLFASLGITKKITPDANGNYLIEGVELAEGVKVNLNLKGIQHLDDGVYIYEGANEKQDFIGLTQKNNNVDLTVSLEFNVVDPSYKKTNTKTTEHRTDTKIYTKTDTHTEKKIDESMNQDNTRLTEKDHKIEVYGTITVTETKRSRTEEKRDWEAYWTTYHQIENEEPNRNGADRAEAPKTGDISALWAAISLASLGGMVMLARKREED